MDKKTRPTHQKLDGQIRELDEPFEVNGKKAMYQSGFGIPSEDINCRCALLQRARWALGEDELETLKRRAKYFGLDKTIEFEDFKEKYLNATLNGVKIEIDEMTPCLRRLSDGKILKTELIKYKPKKSDLEGWEFDWVKEYENGNDIYKLMVEGDDRIQGLLSIKDDPLNLAMFINLVESSPFNIPHNKHYIKKEYSGVGLHLFAEGVKQSLENGYWGFVYFKAKTNLIEYYTKELGAKLIGRNGLMVIEEGRAMELYETYYGTK